MFRTAASIAALSFGLIASGAALAPDAAATENEAEFRGMQETTQAASSVEQRSMEGRGPVNLGQKPVEPKDERLFDYPRNPIPGDEAYGDLGDPGTADRKIFTWAPYPAPNTEYAERGAPGVNTGPDPTDTRGGPIEKKEHPAPELPGEDREQAKNPVTRHLPDEGIGVN